MNVSEGIKRLATAVKWLGHIGVTLVALVAVVGAFDRRTPLSDLAVMLGLGSIMCALVYVAAWIIAGFGKPNA